MKCRVEQNYLAEIMSFLNEKDNARKKQFLEYFSNAPLWLIESMQVIKLDEGVTFIEEGESAKNIFFLITGIVEAIDLRIHGEMFNYKHFKEIYAFGGMEVILDTENYMTTLKTTTQCLLVKIPRSLYEKWLCSDAKALKREAKMLTRNLLDEGRNERLLLFVQGSDRLAFLLIKRYEYYNVNGKLSLDYDRQRIANATGMCIKTVSRAIKYFEDNELIHRENRVITVNSEQYEKLKEIVLAKIEL